MKVLRHPRAALLGVIAAALVAATGAAMLALGNHNHRLPKPGPAAPVSAAPPPAAAEVTQPARTEPSPSELPKPVATDPARAAATTAATTGTGAPPARLASITVSRIGIREAPIYSGGVDAKGTMLIAPGYSVTHFSGSAGFGFGNSVIYGHDDIEGSIFGRLHDLKAGDEVQLTYSWGGQRTFRVADSKLVDPSAVEVLRPTGDVRLTIISCWPINIDTQRIVVTAFPA